MNTNISHEYKLNDLSEIPSKRECPFDPPPEYKHLRSEIPVSKVRTPHGDSAWLVTKHKDIRSVLSDKRFSSNPQAVGFPSYISGDVPPPPGFFLQIDQPDHTRLRKIVTSEFLAAHIETLRPRMQEIIDEQLGLMLALTPPIDFIKVFAIPVAARIICEILGIPQKDHEFVKDCTDIILDRTQPADKTEKVATDLMGYFDKIITEKEKEPTDDLIGRMIIDSGKTGKVNHDEMSGLAALLLLSAYDTMALAIGMGVVVLLEHQQQLDDFMADPTLGNSMVDELVRYLTINHTGLPRVATSDVEIGGQLIKAGEGVIVMLSSGNRDESAFKDPDDFNIHRNEKDHVGFGHGIHKCLGMHFARVELSIAFRTIFEKVPNIKIELPVEELSFRHEMVLYGINKLPITW